MKNRLLVIGTNGLTKQCLPLLNLLKEFEITFFDNVNENPNNFGYLVKTDSLENIDEFTHYLICLGSPKHRKLFTERLCNLKQLSLVSDKSYVYTNEIGDGCIILDAVLIEPYSKIGNCVLLNHGSKIFHDVIIGDFCEIMPGATILGGAQIGNSCRIGSNSTILPKVKIGDNAIIGAGAVVIKDVPSNSTVVGVPAKIIKNEK